MKLHPELKRKEVTLSLLWEEVTLSLLWEEDKAENPEGFQYSRFCELYAEWAGKLDVAMRQEHRAGEKLFVDYAGQTMPVVDRATGEIKETQLFVAVLGASSYTYAEAGWSQILLDWAAPTCAASASWVAFPRWSSPTTSRVGAWHEVIRNSMAADAVLDRLGQHRLPYLLDRRIDEAKALGLDTDQPGRGIIGHQRCYAPIGRVVPEWLDGIEHNEEARIGTEQ